MEPKEVDITKNHTGQFTVAFLAAAAFFCQNCATILTRTSKDIAVTSSPAGARIIIDGKSEGQTPMILKVRTNKSHTIRIEAPGYNPLELRIKRKTSIASAALSVAGNMLLLGGPGQFFAFKAGGVETHLNELPFVPILWVFPERHKETKEVFLGFLGLILGTAGGVVFDSINGANSTLSPTVLDLALTKTTGQSELVTMDSDRFSTVKWIKVRLAGAEKENEILRIDFSD